MKKIFTLVVAMAFCPWLWSNVPGPELTENFTVTFFVNMEGAIADGGIVFDPQIHEVFISGSFSGWPMPGTDNLLKMQPLDATFQVYSISLSLPAGENFYKYFLVEDQPTWSLGEWPGWPDRPIVVNAQMEKFDTWGVYQQYLEFLLPLPNQGYVVGQDEFIHAQIQLLENHSGYYDLYIESDSYFSYFGYQDVYQSGIFDHFFYLDPYMPQGNYRFFIWYYIDGFYGELHSNWFYIENDNTYLEIWYPNEYSFWFSGSYQSIFWSSLNVSSVDILYSLDNGQTWELIIENYISMDYGYYDWLVPLHLEGYFPQSRILVRDSENHETQSLSEAFLICSPIFVFLSPQEGDIFVVGENDIIPVSIEKHHDFSTEFRLYLVNVNYYDPILVVQGTISTAGIYNFDVSAENIFPGQYWLIIDYELLEHFFWGWIEGPAITIVNNNPCIYVLYPNEWEVWYSEISYYISWRSSNIDNVNILYSTDNGLSWNMIAESVESSAMEYNYFYWQVPPIDGLFPESLIKIESSSDPQVFDLSDLFTISGIPLKILHPNSTTVLAAGNPLPLIVENLIPGYIIIILEDQDDNWSYITEFHATEGLNTYIINDTYWWSPGNKRIILISYDYSFEIFSETFLVVAAGTTYPVTFNLDMSNVDDFNPATDHVYLTGTFTNWAIPGATAIELLQTNAEPLTYSVTWPVSPGNCSYKYFSDAFGQGWQGGEWQGNPNREVNINSSTTINDTWGAHYQVFFTLELLAEPAHGGTVSGAGSYNANQWIELNALPNNEFSFVCWKKSNGSIICNTPVHSYRMPAANTLLIAEFSSNVGINEDNLNNAISLFPNPASSIINISSEAIIDEIQIMDINGRIISVQKTKDHHTTISVGSFSPGLYLVKILSPTGTHYHKLVIQR
jgi:hypothetical protein